MHIFVDESGTFSKQLGSPADVSCMAALVVPDAEVDDVLAMFRTLKREWGVGSSELKGSSLNEPQAAQFVSKLSEYDVILTPVVIDLGLHGENDVANHKREQAEKITGNVTRAHTGSVVQDLLELQSRLLALPDQLYAQAVVAMRLVDKVIRVTTMYYSQRRPAELGAFHWVVDAKGRKLTEYERIWQKLVLPLLQTVSFKDPHIMLRGMDYSYFDRFKHEDQAVPSYLSQLVTSDAPPAGITDLRMLLFEHFAVVQSDDDLGIQMSDLCNSIVARALRGTLQPEGFIDLGKLLVQWEDGGFHVAGLATGPGKTTALTTSYRETVKYLRSKARPLIVDGLL